MQQTKVLVITPQYAPDLGPSAPIYTALCEDLQQMGCDVTVVTGFPNYAGSDTRYPRSRRLFQEETVNGVRIRRSYVLTVPKSSLWRRLLYHFSFNVFSTLSALRTGRPDIVLGDAPTLWSGLPLLAKAVLPGIPFVYVVHDIYPDVLFRLGIVTNQRILGMIERVEDFFYDRAVQVSVLSPGFKENLLRKGIPQDKIIVIPACVDVDFIRPLPKDNGLREQWGLKDKFVVLYAGNIGLSQGLETSLEAARLLKDRPDIVLALVGEGASKASLERMANESGLSNVRFFPFLPREDVPLIYALSDCCLVSLKRDIVVESVPSKSYSIMASGRPILATVDPNTEVGRLLSEVQCGLCVMPENPKALAETILSLHKDPLLCSEMGRRGREYVVERYSRKVAARQYCEVIKHFATDRVQ